MQDSHANYVEAVLHPVPLSVEIIQLICLHVMYVGEQCVFPDTEMRSCILSILMASDGNSIVSSSFSASRYSLAFSIESESPESTIFRTFMYTSLNLLMKEMMFFLSSFELWYTTIR